MKRKIGLTATPMPKNWVRALFIICKRKLQKIDSQTLVVIVCTVIFLVQMLIMITALKAQEKPKGLSIGDKVPDVTITNIINYKTATAKVSDFKGKLLILDFWATWCSSCIAKFPEMSSLQKEFPDKLQVLLVNSRNNRDTEERVRTFISKRTNPDGSPFSLATVVKDSILVDLFPHQVIPHYAWIGPRGTLLATTSADQVSRENIIRMLDGSAAQVRVKKDINLDRPLFSSADLPATGIRHYSTFLKGQIDGLPSGNRFRTKNGVNYGRVMTNLPLATMYRVTVRALFPDLSSRQILFEASDREVLAPEFSNQSVKDWQLENLHSYELQTRLENAKHLHQYILEDLNRYSGYVGRMEKRTLPCLVIKRKPRGPYQKATGAGSTLAQVIKILNNTNGLEMMIVDGTGLEASTPMHKPSKIESRADLDSYLHMHGLYAENANKETDVFVIRKNDNQL